MSVVVGWFTEISLSFRDSFKSEMSFFRNFQSQKVCQIFISATINIYKRSHPPIYKKLTFFQIKCKRLKDFIEMYFSLKCITLKEMQCQTLNRRFLVLLFQREFCRVLFFLILQRTVLKKIRLITFKTEFQLNQ